MNKSQITPAFLQALGQVVLDFGFMELAIRTVIIVLSREHGLAKALVPSGNGVSENLELLRRLCHHRVQPQSLGPWLAAIEDTQTLFVERNRIFHGAFFENEAKLLLAKVRKGKRGAPDKWMESEFEPVDLKKVLKRLEERRRQLMDFVDDFSSSEDRTSHAPSQNAHPVLSIKD